MRQERANISMGWYWRTLTVQPRLTVSAWAELYRKLSPESSAEPGQWHNDRAPYQVGFMDALNDPHFETVVWMSSSQVGKTEGGGLNMLGYLIDYDPCPVLIVVPNLDDAKNFSKTRLGPMLRDTPRLRGKIKETRGKQAKSEGQSNEVLHKTFPGGHLTIVGSNSVSGLSSRPIRVVYMDELDRFELSAGSEGDQVGLAARRTETFWNRKMILTSTPGIKGLSRIEYWYGISNQQRYWVPCPHCREFQVLEFCNLVWDKGPLGGHLYKTAHFVCSHCKKKIEERHKREMLREGRWVIANDDPDCQIAGFHIWAAYSPWKSWQSIARQFVQAKHQGTESLKVFINTVLGESFEEESDAPDWSILAARAEPVNNWVVPHGVYFLTAGGDVQLDRIEISVWGWGRDEESWHIGHHVVLGDPALQETWKEVDELLYKTFYQPTTQRSLGIVVATMDTGFKTQPVYYYARRREVVYAVKGSSSMTAARVGHPTKQDIDHLGVVIKDGLDVWPLGTHILKSTVYGRLKLKEAGPGYVHFNKDADAEWYKQLTAERLVTLYNKGYSKQEWRKIRPRNEALDCYVYAYAAALIAGVERINWAKVPVRPSDSPKETSAKASSPRRPPRPNTMQSLLRG